jgi:beta-1,4-mannosyl-glycoprotein beta-1,4-N-acetylglucosaminyltransferase
MLIDVCGLRDELDVFELRLRELEDCVDRFLVVQSEETHAGAPKPIALQVGDARWRRWDGRLATVVLSRIETLDRWVREHAMRECIGGLLADQAPDDLVLMSDVDEVANAEAVREALPFVTGDTWIGFDTQPYYYYLNLRVPTRWRAIALARVATVRRFGAQKIRDYRRRPPILRTGGWHFSYLSGVDAIREKLAAFAHAEYSTDAFRDPFRLDQCIREHRDIFNKGVQFTVAPLSEMPQDVQDHPERYESMLFSEVPT